MLLDATLPAQKRYIDRATETLRGLAAGIAADYEVSDTEIQGLVTWLEQNHGLLDRDPFRELKSLLDTVLEDNVIEPSERDELLDWLQTFSDPLSLSGQVLTDAVRQLHGFLQGIAADGEVTDSEIRDLKDWLEAYQHFGSSWPFDELGSLLSRILADGIITFEERQELADFCENYVELEAIGTTGESWRGRWMLTEAPVLESFVSLCEPDHAVQFVDSTFCFTGVARTGKREELHGLVRQLGGVPKISVSQSLCYLVIGALSQPAWAYAKYGRKIEHVMNFKRQGLATTVILHEDEFLRQAEVVVLPGSTDGQVD